MAIKEFRNKSSVLKSSSRYIQGGDTTVNEKTLGWWERFLDIQRDVTDIDITIDKKYAGRPDLIAYDFYNKASLAWVVLQYNNIVDVTAELIPGKKITIPSKSRLFFGILTHSTKAQPSKA